MPKITRTPTCESRDHVEREALLHCSLRFEGKAPPPYVRGREPVPPQSPSSDPRENQPQQGWIIACTALCLPADVLVIFQAPFGDINCLSRRVLLDDRRVRHPNDAVAAARL
jgi:hypothetical protein